MQRQFYLHNIQKAFTSHPIVALLGPRQCGKTTLARDYVKSIVNSPIHFFDLEDPTDISRLTAAKLTLQGLSGLIVIDEIQRQPELFPLLRVLVDQYKDKQQYLILGSASRELTRQSSESLAGRIAYLELTPFNYSEADNITRLWLRGGFPNAYLAINDESSASWRSNYIKTYLEQDIPNLGFQVPAYNLRRCWMMLAHYHGNIFNSSELGRSLGLNYKTIQSYLDILSGTFMMRQLQPWFENITKRQVRAPKIYFRDSGILHNLLGIETIDELHNHPKLGASWEGIALEEIIRAHQAEPGECYFWATHQQAELDLMIIKKGKRLGFEFKYTDQPKVTKSMLIALNDLKLDSLTIIYPGETNFPLAENIMVYGLTAYLQQLWQTNISLTKR